MTGAQARLPGLDPWALFEQSPGLMLVFDLELVIVAATDAYLAATYTQRAEIVGRRLFEVFPDNPDDPGADGVANLRRSIARAVETRAPDPMPLQKYDVRRASDGAFEERYWRVLNKPVLGPDGAPSVVVHQVEDVTAEVLGRHKAERERDRFFSMTLDLLCVAGLDGYFKRVNPAFRVLGYEEAELLGRPFMELVHPDDRAATEAEMAKLALGRSTIAFENRFRCKDGTYRWLEWSSVPDTDGSIYACARDVTERLAAQRRLTAKAQKLVVANAELRTAREETERANQAKVGFIAMMSHELRTPLNAIIGFSDVLLSTRYGALNERQARYVGSVHQSGRQLLVLINDLLDLSKLEAGRFEVLPTACSLAATWGEVSATLQPLADEQRVALNVELAAELPLVLADPARLAQVLLNLGTNAIKFTPEGGRVAVRASYDAAAQRVRLEVSDTGPGIAAEELGLLFQPFTRLAYAKDAGIKGTGLGLAIAKQLVERMRGSIGVASEPGRGSAFHVLLRAHDAVPSLPPPRRWIEGRAAPLALIVDDEAESRELVELAMRELRFETLVAETGEDALQLAHERIPDLITLDVYLPGIDGWGVKRLLAADPVTKDIPVVMLTISTDRVQAAEVGAAELLTKPVTREDLVRALARFGLSAPPPRGAT